MSDGSDMSTTFEMLFASFKMAAIAQGTVLSLGSIGALAAHNGILEVQMLKKMSLLLTRLLLPALALSFYKNYSSLILFDFGCVFLASSLHICIGLMVGHLAAWLRKVPAPYSQVMALTCALPHPALPVAMLPSIISNWDAVAADSLATANGLATIGLYLTVVLCCFATIVSLEIHYMTQNKSVQDNSTTKEHCSVRAFCRGVLRWLRKQDPTLPCCFGGLVIGVIDPIKLTLEPRGAMSWLAGAIQQTGSMSPAMSIFISARTPQPHARPQPHVMHPTCADVDACMTRRVHSVGGLVWNTRKAALQSKLEAAKKAAEESTQKDSSPSFLRRGNTLGGKGLQVLRQFQSLQASPSSSLGASPRLEAASSSADDGVPAVEPCAYNTIAERTPSTVAVMATPPPSPPESHDAGLAMLRSSSAKALAEAAASTSAAIAAISSPPPPSSASPIVATTATAVVAADSADSECCMPFESKYQPVDQSGSTAHAVAHAEQLGDDDRHPAAELVAALLTPEEPIAASSSPFDWAALSRLVGRLLEEKADLEEALVQAVHRQQRASFVEVRLEQVEAARDAEVAAARVMRAKLASLTLQLEVAKEEEKAAVHAVERPELAAHVKLYHTVQDEALASPVPRPVTLAAMTRHEAASPRKVALNFVATAMARDDDERDDELNPDVKDPSPRETSTGTSATGNTRPALHLHAIAPEALAPQAVRAAAPLAAAPVRRRRFLSHEAYDLVPGSVRSNTCDGGRPSSSTRSPPTPRRSRRRSGEGLGRIDEHERAAYELARQSMASEMWSAAFSADGGAGDANTKIAITETPAASSAATSSAIEEKLKPVVSMNMNEFITICCICKLLVMPALSISLNALMFHLGLIPDIPILRLVLDMYPAIPTAAALVARFNGAGYDDAARYCANCMLPMYLLSIPSIALVMVVSSSLIGA